ncbi:ATM interactor-like [Acanthaster planci]|uniref:ATM interactor-like n=1 Tax=Acanthaster planci TaxID=133434 RepID=A0A8B7ZEM4_ACAPL|nr:ATM interactor-like [Acanthaster planci]XP_022103448.1 ATM interactor-like [Acanthaster planci]
MTTVEVICPSPKELMEQPKRNVPCTVDGCDKLLATTAALKMHVIKRHGIYKNKSERELFSRFPQSKTPAVQKQYFCPVEGCSRHKAGNNPFANMWPLKQHYQQVHGERTYLCRKCDFPFAFELQRRKHEKICGTIFTCSCGVPFTTRQALCMHAMRKKHKLPPKNSDQMQKETPQPQQQVNNEIAPATETSNINENSSLVTVNKVLTIPVPVAQVGHIPRLIVTSQPLQILKAGSSTIQPPSRSKQKTERFLLPKPTILSVNRAAVLHPQTTQIVTINKGVVQSFPVSVAPSQPTKPYKRTLATQTPKWPGSPRNKMANHQHKEVCRSSSLVGGDGGSNSQRLCRDLGMDSHPNSSINCHTQTVVQQNSAHTQTQGDLIMQEAFLSAHIEIPTLGQQAQIPVCEPQQQALQQQPLQQSIIALNRHTQTSQSFQQASVDRLPNSVSIANSLPVQQPHYTVQAGTGFSTNSTSSCDVQTDRWLSSLAQVSDQGTLTDIAGVPTQTDFNVLDFLNLSNSETQTVISQSAFEESTATEHISTQTVRHAADITQTETSIQTTTSDLQDSYMEKIQSTMQTQTNFYSTYLDALLLNESQSQTSPGGSLDSENSASCCQQTQTLTLPAPQTDHQQTQTALPDLSLSTSDFLSLDMYTQTAQQGLRNRNSSLQTQTDSFLEYSLSSMETQTMADFDLGAFDYQSASVQTDSHYQDNYVRQLATTTQVQTQTTCSNSWRLEGADTAARHVQTDMTHAEKLYTLQLSSAGTLTDSHTQTG